MVSFVNGNDVFVILPTGSGKLLCFAVLPFVFDSLYGRVGSIAIVISPLLALMKDQVSSCNARAALTATYHYRSLLWRGSGYETTAYHYRSLLCTLKAFQQPMLVAMWTTVSNVKTF